MDRLIPGARVRATYPTETGGVHAGSVVRQVNGSLEITADSSAPPRRIALAELERLDLSAGRRRGPAAVIGASVGILGGLLLGMACATACVEDGEDKARFAPIAGAALGLSIGALTGIIIAPEHWIRVQFR
jgi:hypothetical protein